MILKLCLILSYYKAFLWGLDVLFFHKAWENLATDAKRQQKVAAICLL